MKNNNGFTLIELLAVVVILGILMIIAVPAVSSNISESRDSEFANSALKFIEAARLDITNFEYSIKDENHTYYIPTKCLETENGDVTSYGNLMQSYVVVTVKDGKYDYYYTGRDSSNHGILLTYSGLIDKYSVKSNVKSINTNVGVGSRTKIYIFSDACTKTKTEKSASKRITEKKNLT